MRLAALLLILITIVPELALADGKARVAVELLTRPGLPLTASQQWYKLLTDLGIDSLQIRTATAGDEMGIKEQGQKDQRTYRVRAILGADGVLNVPGGKFKLQDAARLRKWLDNLADLGSEGVTQPPAAFGLTPSQLSDVNEDLQRPLSVSTKGVAADKAVERVRASLKFPLNLDEAGRRTLADVRVSDELSGLTSGTSLAAILRPAGLGLFPERLPGGQLSYRVARLEPGRQAWPVGWKPKGATKPLPELFEFLNVEINDTKVSETLEAIQARLKVPFLFDYNALALFEIDPAAVQADVPEKRMTYSQILGKVLMQARMRYELRLDDADRPFVWITSVKPAGRSTAH